MDEVVKGSTIPNGDPGAGRRDWRGVDVCGGAGGRRAWDALPVRARGPLLGAALARALSVSGMR